MLIRFIDSIHRKSVSNICICRKLCQNCICRKLCQNRQTLQKPNKLFCYVVFYVKILVLVRILDEFQNSNLDLGPAGGPDHGTLCVSSGPPLLTPMRTLRSKLLLGNKEKYILVVLCCFLSVFRLFFQRKIFRILKTLLKF